MNRLALRREANFLSSIAKFITNPTAFRVPLIILCAPHFCLLSASFFAVRLIVSSNPVYVGSLFGRTLDAFAFKGAFIFVPLYMNIEFERSSVSTSLYYGTMGMIAFTTGIIGGGFLVNKLHREGHKAALFIAGCSLFCGIIIIGQIFIPCDNLMNRIGARLNNTNCMGEICPLIAEPICDSVTGECYASACHAGCQSLEGVKNCSCTASGEASLEHCDLSSCHLASVIYMVCTVLVGMTTGCAVIPGILVLLWWVI